MKLKTLLYILMMHIIVIFTCSNVDDSLDDSDPLDSLENIKILSLGDSYTIGESVCNTCRFPEQLKDGIASHFDSDSDVELKIVAQTGWTTSNLISAVNDEDLLPAYDLTTLLIGVNNQYQGIPFNIYEKEFIELVVEAIKYGKGDASNLIVISIPDYAYTPFGSGNTNVSQDIDKYNAYAKAYCEQNDISYINITDITRNGLTNPNLVASDGLHPSELAYSKFIERILPVAIEKLK